MLAVKILLHDGEIVEYDADDDIKYLSWINKGTYGPPALVAPVERPANSRAGVGDVVLFVNTEAVQTVEVERLSD